MGRHPPEIKSIYPVYQTIIQPKKKNLIKQLGIKECESPEN